MLATFWDHTRIGPRLCMIDTSFHDKIPITFVDNHAYWATLRAGRTVHKQWETGFHALSLSFHTRTSGYVA